MRKLAAPLGVLFLILVACETPRTDRETLLTVEHAFAAAVEQVTNLRVQGQISDTHWNALRATIESVSFGLNTWHQDLDAGRDPTRTSKLVYDGLRTLQAVVESFGGA